jgi:hypothetical protein
MSTSPSIQTSTAMRQRHIINLNCLFSIGLRFQLRLRKCDLYCYSVR